MSKKKDACGGGESALQKLSPVENTIVGIAAGVIDVSSTQWILYYKNASQQRLPLTFDPRVLYRGYSMSCVNMAVLTGLQFPLTGMVTRMFTGDVVRRLSDTEQVSAAFIGGVLSGIACAPMELVMVQQQRYGTSLFGTPAKIVAETGVLGLFRGLYMSCGREGVFSAGMLGLAPTIKRYAIEHWGYSDQQGAITGAIGGGVFCATLSHPMDTIKTCQQGDILGKQYGSVIHTARVLLTEAGITRFFSGWGWRTGRIILEAYLFDFTKTKLSPIFFPHHFQ